MAKYKPTKFHYYDWNFNLWFGSETRARCRVLTGEYPMGLLANAAEGAYKNLLDYCYQEGDVPGDIGGLAALCGMTPETFDMVWPAFKNKFQVHKSKPGRLVHNQVVVRRRAWKQKKKQTAAAGEISAEKRRTKKPNADKDLPNDRSATAERENDSVDHIEVSNKKLVVSKEKQEKELTESACSSVSFSKENLQEFSDDQLTDSYWTLFVDSAKPMNEVDRRKFLNTWLSMDRDDRENAFLDAQQKLADGTWGEEKFTPLPVNHLSDRPWTRVAGPRILPIVRNRGKPDAREAKLQEHLAKKAIERGEHERQAGV